MKTKQTNIEWADYTFNPWRGCTKVSAGCANCYAETLSRRNPAVLGGWGPGAPRVFASEAMWRSPIKWQKDAAKAAYDWDYERRVCEANGIPYTQPKPHRPRVFCASLADWLDDEVPLEWLTGLMRLVTLTPDLDWLLLTKRPQSWKARMEGIVANSVWNDDALAWLQGHPPHNVWVGTSIEDQQAADLRVPQLLQIPAKVRFLSCEPLLGHVQVIDMETGWPFFDLGCNRLLHWVIAGGESGGNARPMHPAWVRSLRDQCAAAGVPFLFKQWGEFIPPGQPLTEGMPLAEDKLLRGHRFPDGTLMLRAGKKYTGRTLDGQIHHAFPA